MKRIHKILVLAAALFLLFAGGFWTLNQMVLPVKVRIWSQEAASKALGRPVTIKRIRLHLWHGFMAEGITVGERPPFGDGPLLWVEKVSGAVLPLPLVRYREVIIPALHLEGAKLRLVRSAEGRWNIEDLLVPRPPSEGTPSSFHLLIPKVVLSGSEVTAQLQQGRPLLVAFRDIQAEAHLGLPAKVEGNLTTRIQANTPEEQGPPIQVSLEMAYAFSDRQMRVKGKTAGPFSACLLFLPPSARAKVLELDGTAQLDWSLHGNPKGPFTLNLEGETNGFRIAVPQPITSGWSGEVPEQLRWEGNLGGQIKAEVPALPLPKGWDNLQGSIRLKQATLGPVPYAGELRQITGEILLTPEATRTESLAATLPSGAAVQMSGSVARDAAQSFGFRVTGEFPLEQLPTLPAAMENFRKTTNPSGQLQIEALGKGALKPSLSIEPVVTARFQDVALTLPNQQAVRKTEGSLRWQPDLLTATKVRGEFLEKPFSLEGTMVNFAQPEVNARLRWDELSAEVQLSISSNRVQLHTVKGTLGPGQFNLFGEVAWPQANLLVEGTIPVQELPRLWPKVFAAVEKQGIQGEVSFRGLLEGNLRQPEARTVDLKLSSPAFQIQGLHLRQAAVHLKQKGNELELASARAHYAEGALRLSGKLDLGSADKPWSARAGIEQIRLEQLASDLKWKVKNLAGLLSAEWDGRGKDGNLASLSGPGSIRIGGGQILEVPLLGDFANFLGLPTLRKIAFQEAEGTFQIGQGKVRTENLQLRSSRAALTFVGQGGFLQGADSPIRWRILPTLSSELLPEESTSKLGKVIARGASYLIGQIEIGGTWKKPKRKFVSKPVTQVLNEQLLNLQDVIGDLF